MQVTGAGHGIGQALAMQLAAQGARVALWDVDAARCEQTAREIRNKGGRAMSYCCDVADRAQVLDTAARVKREVSSQSLLHSYYAHFKCESACYDFILKN
jgi:2-hydroxycyclohexanecarboxyl-CoA dehydrogenase